MVVVIPVDPGSAHNALAGAVQMYAELIGGLRGQCAQLTEQNTALSKAIHDITVSGERARRVFTYAVAAISAWEKVPMGTAVMSELDEAMVMLTKAVEDVIASAMGDKP